MSEATVDDEASARAAQKQREWRSRTRRFLKRLPHRSNVTRYPLIKYWGKSARERSYLWSWKRGNLIRSYYVGWIVTLLPLAGVQILIATALAVIFKANLTVAAALQLVSNPLTMAPILVMNYTIGKGMLGAVGIATADPVSGAAAAVTLGGLLTGVSLGALSHLAHGLLASRSPRQTRSS